MKRKDFFYRDSQEPHKERTKTIITAHPEIRELMGRYPFSFLYILGIITLQFVVAFLVRRVDWYYVLIPAYLIGAFSSHALYVLIHEAAHNLIFKNRVLNYLSGILADTPNFLPSAISFRTYHLQHHSHQGEYYKDADLASKWEARFIGSTFTGKAFWELMFPFFQALRPPRLKQISFMNLWTIFNMFIVFGIDFLVGYYWGLSSLLYLIFSFFFSIGFHPLGARWIQEHFIIAPPQETYSYYGPLNIPALNVGFHNEHHDFPSVPWKNLPKVRQSAPEFYNNLVYHTSWFKLWIRFIFDTNLSLFARYVKRIQTSDN